MTSFKPENKTRVSGFDLPDSNFRDNESLRAQEAYKKDNLALAEQSATINQTMLDTEPEKMPALRKALAEIFYTSALYKKLTDRYAVTVTSATLGGVDVEVFTPSEGIPAKNQHRVLINFHSGSFTAGSRTASHQESIPIAAVGQCKVVSVDYRMGPEHQFPAATEDALNVYKALLKQYAPEQIGLFGCSAGALLSAQLIARLLAENLPLPAAVSMSCWGPHPIDGDSNTIGMALMGAGPFEFNSMPYFSGVDQTDPRVMPGLAEAVLAKFPPSLLMSATRDFLLSSVVHSHAQLVRLGRATQLHIWDGLDHAFVLNPDFSESQASYDVMTQFFDRQLGDG